MPKTITVVLLRQGSLGLSEKTAVAFAAAVFLLAVPCFRY